MAARTLIIAEAGSSHDGDAGKIRALAQAAKAADADVVKWQYWSDAALLAARRHAPELRAVYERYQFSLTHLDLAVQAAADAGVEFMVTTYLPQDVPVATARARRLKIASCEANAIDHLLAHVIPCCQGCAVLVSCGLGADPEVIARWLSRPIDGISSDRSARMRVQLLVCTSAYPAPLNAMHLARLRRLGPDGGTYAGLSDHSRGEGIAGLLSGVAAVAAGATILERHLRLDETDPQNPDYAHALTPDAFGRYVQAVRMAETLLGNELPGPIAAEDAMRPYRVLTGLTG